MLGKDAMDALTELALHETGPCPSPSAHRCRACTHLASPTEISALTAFVAAPLHGSRAAPRAKRLATFCFRSTGERSSTSATSSKARATRPRHHEIGDGMGAASKSDRSKSEQSLGSEDSRSELQDLDVNENVADG